MSDLADVHIFVPPDPSPPGQLRKGEDVTRELFHAGLDFDDPDMCKRYFTAYYESLNRDGGEILKSLTENARTFSFPFRTVASEFRLIDNDEIPVLIRLGKGARLAARIRKRGINRELWRKSQRYCVSVPSRLAEKLLRSGLVEELAEGLFVQGGLLKYSPATGLAVEQDSISPEELLV